MFKFQRAILLQLRTIQVTIATLGNFLHPLFRRLAFRCFHLGYLFLTQPSHDFLRMATNLVTRPRPHMLLYQLPLLPVQQISLIKPGNLFLSPSSLLQLYLLLLALTLIRTPARLSFR